MSGLKKKFNSMKIQTKIFIYLGRFCIILSGLLWILMVQYLPRIYEKQRKKLIYTSAEMIENVLKNSNDVDDIQDIIRTISDEYDVCREIIGTDGETIRSNCVDKSCKIHRLNFMDMMNVIIRTQQSGGKLEGIYPNRIGFGADDLFEVAPYRFDSEEVQSMVYSELITDESGEMTAYMLLNIQLSPVASTISTIKRILVTVNVFMVLRIIILSLYISNEISKPLKAISRDAKQLATGDYETEFSATGCLEINQLTDTLNYTAGELGKVEQLRREFIANVSHDLRTPLTLIGGYAEVMRDIPGENNPENAQVIIDESKRLSTLVNDVLDMSKIQSGAIPMQMKEFSVSDTVKKTAERLSELLRNDGYEIISSIPDVTIDGDEVRIQQCVYNLLINAVNYTGADKKIYLDMTENDDRVRISVTDTGNGVDEDEKDRIWERYYKSDKNHRRAVTGSGIGLSIVKGVVTAHGGTYGVYNADGKGACFWIELPEKQNVTE